VSEFKDMINIINGSEESNKSLASKASNVEIQTYILPAEQTDEQPPTFNYDLVDDNQRALSPFDVELFTKEVARKSDSKGRAYSHLTQNISGYDIASKCIADVVFKLQNTPVESFASKWLPIAMRGTIGTAIHDFIQGTSDQFTELEPSLKIPSIRFSGRLDGLIGNNVLVEIKSCTYADYAKIIKSRSPRMADFYQVMTYKYILENYLHEAQTANVKRRTQPPVLSKYDIDTVQFIYVCHEILASDIEDFGEMLKNIKQIKKTLNSRSNSFFFITALTVKLTPEISKPYIEFVQDKIRRINWYIDNNKQPTSDEPYINKKGCFFCLYDRICPCK